MAHELEKFHRPFSFVKLTGEDHRLSHAPTRLQIIEELERSLAANL